MIRGFWIEVRNFANALILSSSDFLSASFEEVLSESGSWSMQLTNDAPLLTFLSEMAEDDQYYIYCYGIDTVGGGVVEMGAGIVQADSVTWGDDGTATVSGGGLLEELRQRQIRSLLLYQESGYQNVLSVYAEEPDGSGTIFINDALPNTVSGINDGDYIYFQDLRPFSPVGLEIDVGSPTNDTIANLSGEIYTGNGYVSLFVEDGTASAPFNGKTLNQDGLIEFTDTDEAYELFLQQRFELLPNNAFIPFRIRLEVNGGNLTDIEFVAIRAKFLEPETDDIAAIVTHRSAETELAAWAMDAGSPTGTIDGTLAAIGDTSVLAQLVSTTKERGENFRRGSGRTVRHLRDTFDASGLHATDGVLVASVPTVCQILSIQHQDDAQQRITRLYTEVSANGFSIDLEDADTVPAGYSVGDDYVETSSPTILIEQTAQFDVEALTYDTTALANLGVRRAVEEIESGRNQAYTLTLGDVGQNLRVGQTLTVSAVSQGLNGVMRRLNNETLIVMSRSNRVMDGELTVDVTATTHARQPISDRRFLLKSLAGGLRR